jgi:hypothetical protein
MTTRSRALTALVAGALALPFLAAPTSAAGEATPPAPQDITAFCANPYAPQFSDVPADSVFGLAIRCIATAEITAGGPDGSPADQYGPDRSIRRGQMATFIARTMDAADARDRNVRGTTFGSQITQLPPYDGENVFTDVPDDDVHVASINRLNSAGVALGGAAGEPRDTYSPDDLVTRAQMASFINRAAAFAKGGDPADAGQGAGYTSPNNADYYTDDEGSVHQANINGITAVGITVGDGASSYRPAEPVTRGQMSAFIARTLAQLFDDNFVYSLLEPYTGHFAPSSRTDEDRNVSPDSSFVFDVRELSAGFLDRDIEYRITLVTCENVSRGVDDLLLVAPDGDTGFADAGSPSTRIVGVGTTDGTQPPPEGTTNSVAVTPGGDVSSIRIDIENDVEPECVVALIYINGGPGKSLAEGGSSPRLEVDSAGRPLERVGASGRTTFIEDPMTVMTRNVYLGADITRPLRPAPEGTSGAVWFANQNYEMRQIVDQTDFTERAHLLAKEIADTQPDLVGLQEVAMWRSGPVELPPPTDEDGRVIPNATEVDYDFLALLRDALVEAGEPYELVHSQVQSDVEGPAWQGPDPFAEGADARDYRLTMRDVILKRFWSPVVVEAAGGDNYEAVLPFEVEGYKYEFVRGYNWADVTVGDEQVRVINTHLESQLSSFAMWQAQELVQTQVLPSERQVVVLCDCNSDPLNDTTKPGEPIEGIKHQDPYFFLREHLNDAWLDTGTALPGFTSGLNETVDEPAPASFTHRIDLVLTRAVGGPVDRERIVGDDPANRSATGLWPSDHAGVVVRLHP